MKETPAFQLPVAVVHRTVGEQMVLLNLATEQYYGLSEVGADMVNRLVSQPFERAVQALIAEYDTEPERIRADVDALVGALLEAGLLEGSPQSTDSAVRR